MTSDRSKRINPERIEMLKNQDDAYLLSNVDLELRTLTAILELAISDVEKLNNECVKLNRELNDKTYIRFSHQLERRLSIFYYVLCRVQDDLKEVEVTVGQLAGD